MKKKAFTLIELLVVISIIALLVSILMPALSKARENAKRTVCMTRMKQLVICWQMYAMDNNDVMTGCWSNNSTGVSMFGDKSDWAWAPWKLDGTGPAPSPASLPIYAKEREEGIRRGSLFKYTQEPELYHCPSDKLNFRTYSLPDALNGRWGTNVTSGQGDWVCFKKLSQLRRPSEKYIFIEECDTGTNRGFNMDSWTFWTIAKAWTDPLTVWHGGGSNLAYGDGSVNWHKWSDEVSKYYTNYTGGGLSPQTEEGKKDAEYLARGWPRP